MREASRIVFTRTVLHFPKADFQLKDDTNTYEFNLLALFLERCSWFVSSIHWMLEANIPLERATPLHSTILYVLNHTVLLTSLVIGRRLAT